jgi:hypothetical protein
VAAITTLWKCVDKNGDQRVSWNEYFALNQRLYFAIAGERLPIEKAEKRAQQDWKADAHGEDSMSFDGFSKCVFQVHTPCLRKPMLHAGAFIVHTREELELIFLYHSKHSLLHT